MKFKNNGFYSWSYTLIVLLFGLFILQGCSLRLIAPYDEKTEEAIFNTAKTIDHFYGNLLETEESDRAYSKFSDKYVEIESELNALVLRNKVRSLNKDSTDIAERILKLWKKYKERHRKENMYKSGTAKLDRKRFERMFSYAARAEGAKKPEKSDE